MEPEFLAKRAAEILERARETKPLIHHITNQVVMNDTANVTLLVGGLPVMAHALQEVEEMAGASDALVLNIGTLDSRIVEAMLLAGRAASARGIPIVLDPVGAGATGLRDRTSRRLLEELSITVVRGNAAEVGILAGMGGVVRGVEASEAAEGAAAARRLASERGAAVAATGKRDWVSDGERTVGVDNGHPLLTRVTGTGCMATTMVAAMAAVERDPLVAAVAGLVCFGVAAETAAETAGGPGSFKVALFDRLDGLTGQQVLRAARVVVGD